MIAGFSAIAVVILQTLACFGLGGFILRCFRIGNELEFVFRFTWAFALGFGLLGWCLFYFGYGNKIDSFPICLFLIFAALLNILSWRVITEGWKSSFTYTPSLINKCLIAFVFLLLGLDVVEAIAPPTDADSLAYHFAIPKQFIMAGKLEFIPRAIDGAIPLLIQMTYIPPLLLGGELSMTFWVMLTGWASVLTLFLITRCWLPLSFSLLTIILFMTTPAIQYGSGSGQVEVKIILFVFVALFAIAKAIKQDNLKYAAIAGLAIGFYLGSKYIGLLFALSCGITVLFQRRFLLHASILTFVALIAGYQWYFWNWLNTGDPVFPMLFEVLKDHVDYKFWDQAHADLFKSTALGSEIVIPQSITGVLSYPYIATFKNIPVLQSGRTGLGPFGAVVLPFVIVGLWLMRHKLKQSLLLPVVLVSIFFYLIWFFAGGTQVVRHLIVIYPILLLGSFVVIYNLYGQTRIVSPLLFATLTVILVQASGAALFNSTQLNYLLTDKTRQQYLEQTVRKYSITNLVHSNLNNNDKVLLPSRQILYYLNTPYFFHHIISQSLINGNLPQVWAEDTAQQLTSQNITHIIAFYEPEAFPNLQTHQHLVKNKCAYIQDTILVKQTKSRTLSTYQTDNNAGVALLKLSLDTCQFSYTNQRTDT